VECSLCGLWLQRYCCWSKLEILGTRLAISAVIFRFPLSCLILNTCTVQSSFAMLNERAPAAAPDESRLEVPSRSDNPGDEDVEAERLLSSMEEPPDATYATSPLVRHPISKYMYNKAPEQKCSPCGVARICGTAMVIIVVALVSMS
jgi:hypothetical protein